MSGGTGDWGLGVGDVPEGQVAEPASEYSAGPVRSFRDLDVWKDGVELAEIVYRETRSLPEAERYGLTSQLRRAAVSVPSNIAEGWGRRSRADYVRFLHIARGSLFEVATQVEVARRVGLFSDDQAARIEGVGTVCGKRLSRLIAALRRPHPQNPNP